MNAVDFDTFLKVRGADKRLARLTHDVPLPVAAGLEIGAGSQPLCLPDSFEIAYVDRAPGAGIDHVWAGAGSLAAVCGHASYYDFAIAAQVAQYVPNLLGWLRGIHDVLRPGGVLNLSLPDRRFMFDIKRKTSTMGELLDAFFANLACPSPRQVFDHTFGASAVDPARLWSEDIDSAQLPSMCGEHALALAHEDAERARRGEYVDCHCWVFTPLALLDLLEQASLLRLFPFVISQFASTDPGDFEFFICLRRDLEETPDALLAIQLGAIAYVRGIAQRRERVARRLSTP